VPLFRPAYWFRRTSRGIEAKFSRDETALLRDLVAQVRSALETRRPMVPPDAAGDPLDALVAEAELADADVAKPADPVLGRLLPDAYRDDESAATDFRRFTESDLVATKLANAAALLAALPSGGGPVRLTDADADRWLAALNDVRLALGTVLDVDEDSYAELEQLPPRDPRAAALQVYGWLGVLQETLVEALVGSA
jgi:hypothetical protein